MEDFEYSNGAECPRCGGPKWRQAHLCRRCWFATREPVRLFGPEHPHWKGDDAHIVTKRQRAQRAYPLAGCEFEGCECPATDRHHVDGDPGNNRPENVQRLCRRHHMLVDGRLAKLAANRERA